MLHRSNVELLGARLGISTALTWPELRRSIEISATRNSELTQLMLSGRAECSSGVTKLRAVLLRRCLSVFSIHGFPWRLPAVFVPFQKCCIRIRTQLKTRKPKP